MNWEAEYEASHAKTASELDAMATVEFSRLFEGAIFKMKPLGPAEPDVIFGYDGRVYTWKRKYRAWTT